MSLAQARALRRGETPLGLARAADAAATLTRREAHLWLTEAPTTEPLAWWCTHHHLPRLRAWAIAAWVRRVLDTPAERDALERERELRGPAGEVVRVRYVDRLDEIQEEDLDRGASTGVQRAYERAAARYGTAAMQRLVHDHRVLRQPPVWRLGARARALVTPAQLCAEGSVLGHCVAGYAGAVEAGRSVILSIRCGCHRSTVELSAAGRVLQHKGPRNEAPAPSCAAVLRSILRRNGLSEPGYAGGVR